MRMTIPLQTMNGKYMSKGMVVLSGQTTVASMPGSPQRTTQYPGSSTRSCEQTAGNDRNES